MKKGASTLLHGVFAALATGWLAAGSCSVAYSSCNHEPGDCSAPKHDKTCACFEASSSEPPLAAPRWALAVEVDELGRSHVRRWLVTERGPIALERWSADSAFATWAAPFKAP